MTFTPSFPIPPPKEPTAPCVDCERDTGLPLRYANEGWVMRCELCAMVETRPQARAPRMTR